MTCTIVGLFPSQERAESISKGLENIGIKNSDYIIYLTDKESNNVQRPGIWSRLFGRRKPNSMSAEVDKLITSVAIENEEQMEMVKKLFEGNKVVHIYEFQDMTIEQAKDLDYIKKIIEIRAKSEIYAIPELSTSHSNSHEGINSEVK